MIWLAGIEVVVEEIVVVVCIVKHFVFIVSIRCDDKQESRNQRYRQIFRYHRDDISSSSSKIFCLNFHFYTVIYGLFSREIFNQF